MTRDAVGTLSGMLRRNEPNWRTCFGVVIFPQMGTYMLLNVGDVDSDVRSLKHSLGWMVSAFAPCVPYVTI